MVLRALILPTLLLMLAAPKEGRPTPPPKPPKPRATECQATDVRGTRARLMVSWSSVRATEGCFFFSGPQGMGRDDDLGLSAEWAPAGSRARLTFDGPTFEGRSGDRGVQLARRSRHEHGGSTWIVDETIRGAWTSDAQGCPVLQASYRYAECNTTDRAQCPGACVIDARLSARP